MTKLKILFVCVANAGRSQMAEAFANELGGDRVEAWSAGSNPAEKVHRRVVAAMQEKGIDLGGRKPKRLSDVPSTGWDYVVTMGCGDACPNVAAKAKLDWDLQDPKNLPLEGIRPIRDRIEKLVGELLQKAD